MKSILYTLSLLALFSSCGKDNDKNTSPKSKLELISAHDWKYDSMTIYDGTVTVDNMADWEQCQRDNVFWFRSNFEFIEDEGPTKCSSNDNQIAYYSSWGFTADQSSIVVEQVERRIAALSDEVLILSWIEAAGPDTSIYRLRLKK